jgi:prepilin signal peptidase PulO-like enzyme (type II secretory pathway)
LDRLIAPWGLIGLALLVLARLERHVTLLLFTLGYLMLVLLVVPTTEGMHLPDWLIPSFISGTNIQIRLSMTPPQLITGTVLLAGGFGFSQARRRQR